MATIAMHRRRILAVLLLGLSALCLGIVLSAWLRQPPAIQQALYYEQGRALPEFQLTTHTEAQWTNRQLAERWTLAFIGYASCPDICPTTLAELARWYESLSEPERSPLQVVFISVDPERDTTALLKTYVSYFHPDFIAATAGHDQLVPLTRAMGLMYSRSESSSAMGYGVDHSARVALISPDGRLRALFNALPPQGLDPELLTADLRAIRQRW